MLKLVSGWLLVLALIIYGARSKWGANTFIPEQPAPVAKGPLENSAEDLALLNESFDECLKTFSAYLNAGIPEQQNQYVLSPLDTVSKMARFYSQNPSEKIDPSSLSQESRSVLHLPDAAAIETAWKSTDGRRFDAVFVKENDEWRLDWNHFVRYSDYPWSLFLAGSGQPEGEFRLLARERLPEERKDADSVSIVFYAPRFGQPGETGSQSPEFLVSRTSEAGKLLDAAFKAARKGDKAFGSKLTGFDPDELIRVRVKVRRSDEGLERKFEITEVVACHWYSVDEPGVLIEETPAAEEVQED